MIGKREWGNWSIKCLLGFSSLDAPRLRQVPCITPRSSLSASHFPSERTLASTNTKASIFGIPHQPLKVVKFDQQHYWMAMESIASKLINLQRYQLPLSYVAKENAEQLRWFGIPNSSSLTRAWKRLQRTRSKLHITHTTRNFLFQLTLWKQHGS